MFRSKMSNNIVPFPSLSWGKFSYDCRILCIPFLTIYLASSHSFLASRDFAATYGLVDHATPTKGKKRVHSVSLSATSSESNDSNDVSLRGLTTLHELIVLYVTLVGFLGGQRAVEEDRRGGYDWF